MEGTGGTGITGQGVGCAISADGNNAVVGGHFDNSNQGAVWVYIRSGGIWSQQGGKLVGTGSTTNSFMGDGIALSADGNTFITGGGLDNGGTDAAWVFIRRAWVWVQQVSTLIGTARSGSTQAVSVAVSPEANRTLVGAFVDN